MPKNITPKVLSWASILEDNTADQAVLSAQMPFITPHIALMPDAHLGKGATVGSVIPTERAVIPAAVGVDIGCGMVAARTQFHRDDITPDRLAAIHAGMQAAVPLSKGQYNTELTESASHLVAQLRNRAFDTNVHPEEHAPNWHLQLGSLGGGNHFRELSYDEDGRIWLFLHSGSRGVGNKIAQHHIAVAQKLMELWHIVLPTASNGKPEKDLAYLPQGTREFDAYMADLQWAQAFAAANREEMLNRDIAVLGDVMGEPVESSFIVNCHHNYTSRERHFGRDLIVSRKGAIAAHAGVWGLIPGSMGDASYVVLGKGNRASLCSAPHGAGRVHSRSVAKKRFTMSELRERMAGIAWGESEEFLDEHPSAYKPIDRVMEDAADLVEVRHTLRQLVNVKGA